MYVHFISRIVQTYVNMFSIEIHIWRFKSERQSMVRLDWESGTGIAVMLTTCWRRHGSGIPQKPGAQAVASTNHPTTPTTPTTYPSHAMNERMYPSLLVDRLGNPQGPKAPVKALSQPTSPPRTTTTRTLSFSLRHRCAAMPLGIAWAAVLCPWGVKTFEPMMNKGCWEVYICLVYGW